MKSALIGCGSIAPLHVQAVRALGADMAAVCDTDIRKAENFRKQFGLDSAKVYSSYTEMFDEEKPDVVHIATPHHLHAEMSAAALKRNINVLSEKPLCINPGEITILKNALKESSAKFGVCFQNRYLNETRFIKNYLADKKILYSFGSVVWGRDEKYYKSADWRGRFSTEGGGVGINQAIHTLDLLLWIGGRVPEKVYADVSNRHLSNVIEVEDTISAYFNYGEFRGQFYATTAAYRDMPVEVVFQTGEETVAMSGGSVFINGKKADIADNGLVIGKNCWGAGHGALIADFYHSLKTGEPFAVDIFEAEKTMKTLFAVYASKGKEILL